MSNADGTFGKVCEECDGHGKVPVFEGTCSKCSPRCDRIGYETCSECNGSGVTTEPSEAIAT